jgi:hypothetical protein
VPPRFASPCCDYKSPHITGCAGDFNVAIVAPAEELGPHMTAVTEGARVVSVMPDHHDVPLDVDITIDSVEYARIMRGIPQGGEGHGSTVPVSAFNSSI